MTIVRVLISAPETRSAILILTRSQPRSLLSIAKSKSVRSRRRSSRSRKKRTAQICFCVSGRLLPTVLPAFQAARDCMVGSYCECPIVLLHGPDWPSSERGDVDWFGAARWLPCCLRPIRTNMVQSLSRRAEVAAYPAVREREWLARLRTCPQPVRMLGYEERSDHRWRKQRDLQPVSSN